MPSVAEGIGKAAEPKKYPYDNMIEIKVSYDSDKKRALEDTRHWAALALTPEEKMSVEDPVEMQKLADALPVERAASRWIVSNDPDEGGGKGRRLCRAGLQASGVPCAGAGPGALPEALCRSGIAQAAQEVRLMQRVELLAVPGPSDDQGRRRSRPPDRRAG